MKTRPEGTAGKPWEGESEPQEEQPPPEESDFTPEGMSTRALPSSGSTASSPCLDLRSFSVRLASEFLLVSQVIVTIFPVDSSQVEQVFFFLLLLQRDNRAAAAPFFAVSAPSMIGFSTLTMLSAPGTPGPPAGMGRSGFRPGPRVTSWPA